MGDSLHCLIMNVSCLTVNDELSPTFQPQNPKPALMRAQCAVRASPAVPGVRVSVPLVNNRKGSLLSPAALYLHRLSLASSRELYQSSSTGTGASDAIRLHRACSLPVKYRYHSSHGSTSTIGPHTLCKTRPGFVGNACGLTGFRNTKQAILNCNIIYYIEHIIQKHIIYFINSFLFLREKIIWWEIKKRKHFLKRKKSFLKREKCF